MNNSQKYFSMKHCMLALYYYVRQELLESHNRIWRIHWNWNKTVKCIACQNVITLNPLCISCSVSEYLSGSLYGLYCDNLVYIPDMLYTGWHHIEETFAISLAHCYGGPPVSFGFPSHNSLYIILRVVLVGYKKVTWRMVNTLASTEFNIKALSCHSFLPLPMAMVVFIILI